MRARPLLPALLLAAALLAPAAAQVVSVPSDGDVYTTSSTIRIAWNFSLVTTPNNPNIIIGLYVGTGLKQFALYNTGVNTSVVFSETQPNIGFYYWQIPSNLSKYTSRADYSIGVTRIGDGLTVFTATFYSGLFNITAQPLDAINITSPAEGAVVKVGSSVTVSWTGVTTASVRVESVFCLRSQFACTLSSLANITAVVSTASANSTIVTIPTGYRTALLPFTVNGVSSNYYPWELNPAFRVSELDASGNIIRSRVGPFFVVPGVRMLSPTGNIVMTYNTPFTVKWVSNVPASFIMSGTGGGRGNIVKTLNTVNASSGSVVTTIAANEVSPFGPINLTVAVRVLTDINTITSSSQRLTTVPAVNVTVNSTTIATGSALSTNWSSLQAVDVVLGVTGPALFSYQSIYPTELAIPILTVARNQSTTSLTWTVPGIVPAGPYAMLVRYSTDASLYGLGPNITITNAAPCALVSCGPGTCSSGVCVCPAGTIGQSCELSGTSIATGFTQSAATWVAGTPNATNTTLEGCAALCSTTAGCVGFSHGLVWTDWAGSCALAFSTAASTASPIYNFYPRIAPCADANCSLCQNTSLGSCVQCSSSTFLQAGLCVAACSPGWQATSNVCSVCTAGTFKATSGSAACTAWSTCASFQYQSASGNSTTDVQCTNVTACTALQYQTAAPTNVTNRVCAALANCTAGFFVSTNSTATSNRVCTTCSTGFFQTGFNAAACQAVAVCSAVQYETAAPTFTSDRICASLTNCTSGQFVLTNSTVTTNRVCANCSTGFYQPASNALACLAATNCSSTLQYETRPLTTTADRLCANLSVCPAGFGLLTAPTATSDRFCTACVAVFNFSSAPGTAACSAVTPCSALSFETAAPTTVSDRTCQSLTNCTAGQFISTNNTATTDRFCSNCSAGFFALSVNVFACTAFSSCAAGQRSSVDPSSTTDRVCEACPAESYQPAATTSNVCLNTTQCLVALQYQSTPYTATSNRGCTALTVCLAGQETNVPATATTDRTCRTCSPGFYQDVVGQANCKNLTNCTLMDMVETIAPTNTSDRRCGAAASTASLGSDNLPIIIGAVVGGVCCLFFLIILLCLLYRRKKNKKENVTARKLKSTGAPTVHQSPLYTSPQQMEMEEMERQGMRRQSSFYASIAALPAKEQARTLHLLEESSDVGSSKGNHRLSRRLEEELDRFEPALLGQDEDPHLYAQIGELGRVVRDNPTYARAGPGVERDNPTYAHAGPGVERDNPTYARPGLIERTNPTYVPTPAEPLYAAAGEPAYHEITLLRPEQLTDQIFYLQSIVGDTVVVAKCVGEWRGWPVYLAQDGSGNFFACISIAPAAARATRRFHVCQRDASSHGYVAVHEEPFVVIDGALLPGKSGKEALYATVVPGMHDTYMDVRRPGKGEEYLTTGAARKGPHDTYMDVRRPGKGEEYLTTDAARQGPHDTYMDVRRPGKGEDYMTTDAARKGPHDTYMDVRRPGKGEEYMAPGPSARGYFDPAPTAGDHYMDVRHPAGDHDNYIDIGSGKGSRAPQPDTYFVPGAVSDPFMQTDPEDAVFRQTSI